MYFEEPETDIFGYEEMKRIFDKRDKSLRFKLRRLKKIIMRLFW
jgi:hypothetical protein